MSRPLVRLAEPRLLVGDTGALMNEVVQGTRNRRLTSLIVALDRGSARLFLPRHVLVEVERDLPDYAVDRGVDANVAMWRWRQYYLPYARVVNVPEAWGVDNPLVQAVVERHETDAPSARLAGALASCFVLAEDPDLVTYGFGNRDWLPMLHAFANHAEAEMVASGVYAPTMITGILSMEAGRAVARWPRWAQLVLLLVVGTGLYLWHRDGRAKRHLEKVKEVASEIWRVIEPPLAELLERHTQAALTRLEHEVRPASAKTLPEEIARVLALGPDDGMLAREVVDQVGMEGTVKNGLAEVRMVLRECAAFTEVSRGRWQLGVPATDTKPELRPEEFAEWFWRSHVKTLPTRPKIQQP